MSSESVTRPAQQTRLPAHCLIQHDPGDRPDRPVQVEHRPDLAGFISLIGNHQPFRLRLFSTGRQIGECRPHSRVTAFAHWQWQTSAFRHATQTRAAALRSQANSTSGCAAHRRGLCPPAEKFPNRHHDACSPQDSHTCDYTGNGSFQHSSQRTALRNDEKSVSWKRLPGREFWQPGKNCRCWGPFAVPACMLTPPRPAA